MFVRWESQEVGNEEQGRLPGYQEAVVRRFDAPEALDTRFYEVHAKSALNRVPQRSRMPFPWTINPYGAALMPAISVRRAIPRSSWRTAGPASSATSARERDLRDGAARRVPALRDHESARPLDGAQARLPGHARERHGARHERRPPVPHRTWVEARRRRRTGSAAATAPDAEQQADGDRCIRRVAARDGRVQARLSVRGDPRRRTHLRRVSTTARTADAGSRTSSVSHWSISRRLPVRRSTYTI